MSIRKENNGIDQGEPSKIEANHGKDVANPPAASFKEQMSGLPSHGSDTLSKVPTFGKDKISNA